VFGKGKDASVLF